MSDPLRTAAAHPLRWVRTMRHHLRRSRVARGAMLAALGLFAGLVLDQASQDARQARAAWEPVTTAWIMRHDAAAGTALAQTHLEMSEIPRRLLPADAVRRDPSGQRLRHPVAAGEILRDGRLVSGGRSEIAARLQPGRVGVSIEVRGTAVTTGDLVHLYGGLGGETLTTAPREVVASEDGLATVGVMPEEVPPILAAIAAGGIATVLVG